MTFTYFYMSSSAHEQKHNNNIWPVVGVLNRCGQRITIYDVLWLLTKWFKAYWSQFFADFDRFLVLMSRSCWDLAIFVVTQDNNDNDSRSLCPLYICTWSNYTAVQWFTLIRCLAHDVTLWALERIMLNIVAHSPSCNTHGPFFVIWQYYS